MKVINANTIEAKDELIDLIFRIPDVPNTREQVDFWLTMNLGTSNFGAWIAYDKEDKAVGFIICEMVEPLSPKTYIAFDWTDINSNINGELMNKIEEWTKLKNIAKILLYTKKSPRAVEKKYGFKLIRSIMEKDIDNGKPI